MDGQLQSLIDALDVATDERMVRAALKSFATACGYERFAYLQTAGGEIKTFNSYAEEWQGIYFENHYSRIDPVITTAKRRMEMFAWSADDWSVRGLTKDEKLFRSQAIDFGVRSGFTIPVDGSFGRFVTVNGIKLYYEKYGNGPVLLLLHGNGGSIVRMACQIAFFSSSYKVVAVDLPLRISSRMD